MKPSPKSQAWNRIMKPSTYIRILVCMMCGNSFALVKRDLPDTCGACKEPAHWRVAGPDEITASDRRFLADTKITAE